MEIIEQYKRKAREGVSEVLQMLHRQENNEEDSQATTTSGSKLIEEVQANTDVDDYQQKQFQYFAEIPKNKIQKCVVCKTMNPKYTCPKCKIRYCSNEHYKTHNLFCSQKFFKEEVENLLKKTKMGKKQQKNMIQMLKSNEQQLAKDNQELVKQIKIEQISQDRLNYILQKLDREENVELTQNQTKCFEQYLKEIQFNSIQNEENISNPQEKDKSKDQSPIFQEYLPFWKIQQGIQQYFIIGQSIAIQEYNQSSNKQLLEYRRIASEKLKAKIQALNKTISFKKTSIFVIYDLIQTVYITTLLFRAFNGQYTQNPEFLQSFIDLYDEQLSKNISELSPKDRTELLNHNPPQIGHLFKSNMAKIQNQQLLSLFKSWLPIIFEDSKLVFENKYYCLQLLLRLLQLFGVGSESEKISKKTLRLIKKIQFLLIFAHQIFYKQRFIIKDNISQSLKQGDLKQMVQLIIQKDNQQCKASTKEQEYELDKQTKEKQTIINKLLLS